MLTFEKMLEALKPGEEDPIIFVESPILLNELWKAVCVTYTKRSEDNTVFHKDSVFEKFNKGVLKYKYVIYWTQRRLSTDRRPHVALFATFWMVTKNGKGFCRSWSIHCELRIHLFHFLKHLKCGSLNAKLSIVIVGRRHNKRNPEAEEFAAEIHEELIQILTSYKDWIFEELNSPYAPAYHVNVYTGETWQLREPLEPIPG